MTEYIDLSKCYTCQEEKMISLGTGSCEDCDQPTKELNKMYEELTVITPIGSWMSLEEQVELARLQEEEIKRKMETKDWKWPE